MQIDIKIAIQNPFNPKFNKKHNANPKGRKTKIEIIL